MVERYDIDKMVLQKEMKLVEVVTNTSNFDNDFELRSLEDLLELAEMFHKKVIYVTYNYIEMENSLISIDAMDKCDIPNELQKRVLAEVEVYNEHLNSLDFEQVYITYVYFTHDGYIHFVSIDNPYFEGVMSADYKLKMIEYNTLLSIEDGELKEIYNNQENTDQDKLNYIAKVILDDERFHNSTNASLRRIYANKINEEHSDLERLLRNTATPYIGLFIESLWKEYKITLNNNR